MRFHLFFFSAIIQIALALAPARAEPPPLNIAVLYWSSAIPGQVAMRKGLEEEAARINAGSGRRLKLNSFVAGDGDEGISRQIGQMRQAIFQKVDAIIIQPTDNAALSAPLLEANAKGIPVIAYDQYISQGELAAYATSNNRQAGYLDGEYTAASFPDNHMIKIVLVEYPHVSSTVERVDGFIDALKESGQPFTILRSYQAVEPVQGHAAGKAILADFPKQGSVDVVFTVNDGGGLAVVEELAAARRDEIFVATIDGDPASVENIRAKRLTRIDSAQFCGPLGATALRLAYDILNGGKPPGLTLVPVFPITAETLHRYPGWSGPIPADFPKPWPSSEPIWKGMGVTE